MPARHASAKVRWLAAPSLTFQHKSDQSEPSASALPTSRASVGASACILQRHSKALRLRSVCVAAVFRTAVACATRQTRQRERQGAHATPAAAAHSSDASAPLTSSALPASPASASARVRTPASMCSGVANSSGWWLSPFLCNRTGLCQCLVRHCFGESSHAASVGSNSTLEGREYAASRDSTERSQLCRSRDDMHRS